MSSPESNYYYSQDANMNNYFNTINNYISTVNNSINYLNNSTEIISSMYTNLDYYYYWNNYNRNYNYRNYVSLENNRRRRVYNEEINVENNNQNVEHAEPRVENEEEQDNNENEETNEEREERINNHYRELSRQNLINAIAINITKLKYRDVPNPIDTMCAITQEDFEPDDDVGIIDNCGHIFKYDSLLNWLIRHQTCPNCRHSVLTDSNLIRYIDRETNEGLYLTNSQFRRHVLRRLFGNFLNRNSNGSSNVLSISVI
jgi:hypothetical protein